MAPKRSSAKEDPPASSSSESEEIGSEEEESESEHEKQPIDKKTTTHLKKSDSNPNPVPSSAEPASSSEAESDSESDSPPAEHQVQPISSKPTEEPTKSKKPRSKTSVPDTETPEKPVSSAKRQIETEARESRSKRAKKKSSELGGEEGSKKHVEDTKKQPDDNKKPLFQRLWSDKDEIVILKGAIDYIAKKGTDPSADMNAFLESIKKSLQVGDVSKAQLADKVRRLRKKFENNVAKSKNGEDKIFTKSHDQKAFDLSKKIWGSEKKSVRVETSSPNGKVSKNSKELNAKAKKLPEKNVNLGDTSGSIEVDLSNSKCLYESRKGLVALDARDVKEGLEWLGREKYTELEEKWRKLRVKETELYFERIALVEEEAKAVLEVQNAAAAAAAVVGH